LKVQLNFNFLAFNHSILHYALHFLSSSSILLLQQQVSDAQFYSPLLNTSDNTPSTTENNAFDGETDVTINFALPAGSYATALIRELMKNNDFI
jgi:tRNA pseudouridine synthase D (TruD)